MRVVDVLIPAVRSHDYAHPKAVELAVAVGANDLEITSFDAVDWANVPDDSIAVAVMERSANLAAQAFSGA